LEKKKSRSIIKQMSLQFIKKQKNTSPANQVNTTVNFNNITYNEEQQ